MGLIINNSHPWIILIDWLSFPEEGLFEIGRSRPGGGKILDVDGEGGLRVLKIGQFSWTLYMYHP